MGEDDSEAPHTEDPPAKVFGVGNFGVDDEVVGEAPLCRHVQLVEASRHGFAGGVGEGIPVHEGVWRRPSYKGILAEAMLVKSPKMVAKPLMPKSLANAVLA